MTWILSIPTLQTDYTECVTPVWVLGVAKVQEKKSVVQVEQESWGRQTTLVNKEKERKRKL